MAKLLGNRLALALAFYSNLFTINQAAVGNVNTPNSYQYTPVGVTGARWNFQVQANNDAAILLCGQSKPFISSGWSSSQIKSNANNCVEVVLGGWSNTQSVIRTSPQQGNPPVVLKQNGVLLSGWTKFSLDWRNGNLIVKRQNGRRWDTLMVLNGFSNTISRVGDIGVSTGWGSTGMWKCPLDNGSFNNNNGNNNNKNPSRNNNNRNNNNRNNNNRNNNCNNNNWNNNCNNNNGNNNNGNNRNNNNNGNNGNQRKTSLQTPAAYQYYPISVPNNKVLEIDVRTSNDATIMLCPNSGNYISSAWNFYEIKANGANCIEIDFGGWANSKSVVRAGAQNSRFLTTRAGAAVDANAYKKFEIDWSGNDLIISSYNGIWSNFMQVNNWKSYCLGGVGSVGVSGWNRIADWEVYSGRARNNRNG